MLACNDMRLLDRRPHGNYRLGTLDIHQPKVLALGECQLDLPSYLCLDIDWWWLPVDSTNGCRIYRSAGKVGYSSQRPVATIIPVAKTPVGADHLSTGVGCCERSGTNFFSSEREAAFGDALAGLRDWICSLMERLVLPGHKPRS